MNGERREIGCLWLIIILAFVTMTLNHILVCIRGAEIDDHDKRLRVLESSLATPTPSHAAETRHE